MGRYSIPVPGVDKCQCTLVQICGWLHDTAAGLGLRPL
ncbi:hypothetical protein A2U01_0048851 [Trifolium medium]|uniref:Uncharacterized protein n=1 Tax=Trifolium medium TaxID=97028 RepID=A0A392QTE9_9FABA|nr:hypothetical protein [Trifolium medium]